VRAFFEWSSTSLNNISGSERTLLKISNEAAARQFTDILLGRVMVEACGKAQ